MTRGIPEPPPVPVIEELEATIRVLIVLMEAVREGSAEHRMIVRQLTRQQAMSLNGLPNLNGREI